MILNDEHEGEEGGVDDEDARLMEPAVLAEALGATRGAGWGRCALSAIRLLRAPVVYPFSGVARPRCRSIGFGSWVTPLLLNCLVNI